MKELRKKIAICVLLTMIAPIFMEVVPFLGKITQISAATSAYHLEESAGAIGIQSTPARIHVMGGELRIYELENFSFQSSNESVCTVDADGYIKGKKLGTADITVTQVDNGNVVDVYKVTVKASEINKDGKSNIAIGERIGIEQFVNYHQRNVEYQFIADQSDVLNMDKIYNSTENGAGKFAEGVKEGTTGITVKETVDGTTKTLGNRTVTVHKAEILNKKEAIALEESGNTTRFLQYGISGAEYEFTSSDKNVFEINNGLYVAKSKGTAIVSVKEIYKGEERSLGKIEIIVGKAYLDINKITIASSSNLSYHIQGRDNEAKYTFQSDNPKIVSVDFDGGLTGIKQGKAVITVFETKGKDKLTLGKVAVTVVNARLHITNTEVGINEIERLRRSVDCIDYNNTEFRATSSNPEIISVRNNYRNLELIPKKAGTSKITVKAIYNGKTTTLGTVTRTVINKKAELSHEVEYIHTYPNSSVYLEDYIKYPNSAATYTYVLDNKSVGTVDKNGVLKLKKAGTVKITFYETYKGNKKKVGTLTLHIEL